MRGVLMRKHDVDELIGIWISKFLILIENIGRIKRTEDAAWAWPPCGGGAFPKATSKMTSLLMGDRCACVPHHGVPANMRAIHSVLSFILG